MVLCREAVGSTVHDESTWSPSWYQLGDRLYLLFKTKQVYCQNCHKLPHSYSYFLVAMTSNSKKQKGQKKVEIEAAISKANFYLLYCIKNQIFAQCHLSTIQLIKTLSKFYRKPDFLYGWHLLWCVKNKIVCSGINYLN